ncbi:hypothetical protein GQ55_2G254300 [Panicum hallii var. hallii]|uniref:Uncharacterized protein n=1 Tax=Panicum hallii var. hallii TaxID=1504633 RepID=A0A2T7ES78_9POAL|nr:hypothetical protein GQ55_2G254300 [Panicum hallii var. hallii]
MPPPTSPVPPARRPCPLRSLFYSSPPSHVPYQLDGMPHHGTDHLLPVLLQEHTGSLRRRLWDERHGPCLRRAALLHCLEGQAPGDAHVCNTATMNLLAKAGCRGDAFRAFEDGENWCSGVLDCGQLIISGMVRNGEQALARHCDIQLISFTCSRPLCACTAVWS